MNKGDVFILDLGLKVYQWNRMGSSAFEKNKVRSTQITYLLSSGCYLLPRTAILKKHLLQLHALRLFICLVNHRSISELIKILNKIKLVHLVNVLLFARLGYEIRQPM